MSRMGELAAAHEIVERIIAINDNHRRRNTDPATSHASAGRVKEFDKGIFGKIVLMLAVHDSMRHGMTSHELAEWTGLTVWQVNKRLPEMERMGLVQVLMGYELQNPGGCGVCKTVPLTRPGPSGRPCRLWVKV